MKEKIQQQVHLNAVKNYQAPKIEVIHEEGGQQQPQQQQQESKPVKSILKKDSSLDENSAGSGKKKKSAGKVNYALDLDDADKDEPVPKATIMHNAEVYVVNS